MNLYTELDKIQARPGMYLSQVTFKNLCDFISGYVLGSIGNSVLDLEEPPFYGFGDFVISRLGRPNEIPIETGFEWVVVERTATGAEKTTTFGRGDWRRIISEVASDDNAALELFFCLLRQYREQA